MTSEMKQQYTLKVTQANKTQMIVVLYEILLAYLEEAREAHQKGCRAEFREGIRKARACNNELMASLNFETELAMNFLQLYLYVNRELVLADIRNQTKELDHIKGIVQKLHASYEILSKQDFSDPVMSNAQEVYAGLTYGKNTLTENLSNQGSDRGFRV